MEVKEINSLVLAFIGDSIFDVKVKLHLLEEKYKNVDSLQKESIKYVSAKAQASFIKAMIDKELLSEEELNVVKRARNYKTTSHPRNCDIVTYKYATGLEALIGYLVLSNKEERVDEIMNFIFGLSQC